MRAKSKTPVVMALLGVSALLLAVPAFAQDKQSAEMQIFREKLRADKKLLVSDGLKLTDTESKAFWPVYDSYQKEMSAVNDRVIKLIQDYAKSYTSMTDDVARKLVDDYVAAEGQRLQVRQAYLPKFRKALPEIKVARLYQLENKIQAAVNYDLASNIPMVQ